MSESTNDAPEALRRQLARRHYFCGWCGLLLFLSLGALLEVLHGFKLESYVGRAATMRRLMWTLAHAHGTLLSLVQIAFALGLAHFGRWTTGRLKLASFFLLDAAVLLPLGFFLGGIGHSETDPSRGVLLVPLGAVLLFAGAALVAWSGYAALREPMPADTAGGEAEDAPPPA